MYIFPYIFNLKNLLFLKINFGLIEMITVLLAISCFIEVTAFYSFLVKSKWNWFLKWYANAFIWKWKELLEISIHKIRVRAYAFEFQMNAVTTLWFFAIFENLECKLWPACHSYWMWSETTLPCSHVCQDRTQSRHICINWNKIYFSTDLHN